MRARITLVLAGKNELDTIPKITPKIMIAIVDSLRNGIFLPCASAQAPSNGAVKSSSSVAAANVPPYQISGNLLSITTHCEK